MHQGYLAEQQRPGFLADEDRGASAQDAAGAADGPFQVEERDFDEPSFLVEDGELAGGIEVRVQEGGEQPDLGGFRAAAAGAGQHGEADEPRDGVRQRREGGAGGGLAAAGAHAGALAEQHEFRSVFQQLKGLEGDAFRAVLDAPQQVGAGAGEPDEAVHGQEAAVGEIQLPGAERVLQLVGQGVLAVEVTADDGGPPAAGARVQQPHEAEQRFRAGSGDPELLREQRVVEQFQGGAVDLGDLQAERGPVLACGKVVPGRVSREHGPGRGLPGPFPGLGVGGAGRHRGAGPDRHAGHLEYQGEDRVVAEEREQRPGDQAQRRDLGVQRPLLLVRMLRSGCRGDRPAGQQ